MAVVARKRMRRASISATHAAKNFGALVDRVRETGITYDVERQGRPIAAIAPIATQRCTLAELAEWLDRQRGEAAEFATEVRRHARQMNRPRVPASRWQR